MKLIKIKTRGPGPIIDTGWLDISSGITAFSFENQERRDGFGLAIEAINPLYEIMRRAPFQLVPGTIISGGYQKKISPSKRTMSFAIFTSDADLVKALSSLSPFLFETDRIETGRRLDYSRWFNFVELASSTRWSEISSHFKAVGSIDAPPETLQLLDDLRGADRIKGRSVEILADCLTRNKLRFEKIGIDIVELSQKINREPHFHQAFKMVAERMPLTTMIGSQPKLSASYHIRTRDEPCDYDPVLNLLAYFIRKVGDNGSTESATVLGQCEKLVEETSKRCLVETDFTLRAESGGLKEIEVVISARQPVTTSRVWSIQLQCAMAQAVSAVLGHYPPLLIYQHAHNIFDQQQTQEIWQMLDHFATSSQLFYLHDFHSEPPKQAHRIYHESEIALGVSSQENTPETDSHLKNHDSVA